MNSFDHFVKSTLNIRYYGRYVDDFVIIHTDKNYLVQIQKEILNFLQIKLQLTLHPKNIPSTFQQRSSVFRYLH